MSDDPYPSSLDDEVRATSIGSSESLAAHAARGPAGESNHFITHDELPDHKGEFVPFADANPKGCEACSFSPDGCSFCSGRSAIESLADRGHDVIDATAAAPSPDIYNLPADPDQEIPQQ